MPWQLEREGEERWVIVEPCLPHLPVSATPHTPLKLGQVFGGWYGGEGEEAMV
jgi:hypothetical protein